MMGSKHTPGPWINAKRSAGAHIHADQGEVAWLRSFMGVDDEQIEANAHLIAAAPDLLTAARCALGHLTGNMDGDMDLGEPGVMLRAAIEKAEGRS